jgi:hypothetical protein
MNEQLALQEYVEVNTHPGCEMTEEAKDNFLAGYRAAQWEIGKAYDLIDQLSRKIKKIKFLKNNLYNQYEVNILTQRILDKYFVKTKKVYKCIEPFTLKYTVEENEG